MFGTTSAAKLLSFSPSSASLVLEGSLLLAEILVTYTVPSSPKLIDLCMPLTGVPVFFLSETFADGDDDCAEQ